MTSAPIETIPPVEYPGLIVPPPMAPLNAESDLGKGILVPHATFERILENLDWTWQQLTRGEFPPAIYKLGKDTHERLQLLQLAIICEDPLLWCTAFLREPEDIDHKDPYQFFDYQVASLRCETSVVHQDGAEVGKTREIVAWSTWKNHTCPSGSGLIGAPLQVHLDEIIDAKLEQLSYNPLLERRLVKHKKQPYTQFKFSNGFKEDYRPAGFDGNAYRGVHAKTYGIVDEAAKKKNPKQWSEFWRSLKPSATGRVYSVPDGDRESGYYKLTQRATSNTDETAGGQEDAGKSDFKDFDNYVWTLFRWGKDLMPAPYWTPERKRFYVDQYGGEDSPDYRHNVLGEHGDPENSVFPWAQLKHCIRDVPEYRVLKVLVDTAKQEVIVKGSRCDYVIGTDGPQPSEIILREELFDQTQLFEVDESGDSQFKRLIREFFVSVPGLRRGGGDFGFAPDPTELTIWNIIGKRDRLVSRLQLKQVTYDQQCQALDAMDDLCGGVADTATWGTDYGNAGSAVAHDLQGLQIYQHKSYEDRLRGFMFQSTTDNVDESGEPLTDAKTGKPAKITLKELATDLIVKQMQRQLLELPADPDIISDYTNHTCRIGERQRIYNKQKDHLIDSHRTQKLAGVLGQEVEDIFA
ncbi:hypothetical protein [Geopsychrobacter electrodiphilus]|uniref:hypothetical protein n=1 Tax=Geopsychrobacter electrodiphilus TaxID=225196 RepID=UPI00036F041F|nr:hypothetical protein [Geopsychrobacter electrodiphilus]